MENGAAAKLVTDFKVLIDDTQGLAKTAAGRAGGRIGELRQRLRNRLEEGKNALATCDKSWIKTTQAKKSEMENYLREHTWTALLVAAGIGALCGFFLCRNGSSGSSREGEEQL